MISASKYIENHIKELNPGTILFPSDFRGAGSENAIKLVLSRLTHEGIIERLGHGIYYLPQYDEELGKLTPSMEKIAKAIAAREQVRILPTGSTALNQLGLSTQIPMNAVYLTDGARRTIHIGEGTIIFKPTTPKKFAHKGKYSGLLIRALEDINLKDIDSDMYRRIRKLVQKEDNELLEHDLKLAPAKIHDYLLTIIKEQHHEMDRTN